MEFLYILILSVSFSFLLFWHLILHFLRLYNDSFYYIFSRTHISSELNDSNNTYYSIIRYFVYIRMRYSLSIINDHLWIFEFLRIYVIFERTSFGSLFWIIFYGLGNCMSQSFKKSKSPFSPILSKLWYRVSYFLAYFFSIPLHCE